MSVEYADKDSIEIQASQWILRRDRGDFSSEIRAELEAWLSADSRHREAYLRLTELWKFAGGLKVWRPADGQIDPQVLISQPVRAGKSRPWPLALAATVLLLLGAVSLGYLWQRQDVYSTPIGGYQRLVLEDGSVLQLNTDSEVQVRLTEQRREVRLLRGEAYFDIAPDARRPFDVLAGGTVVRAVGTAFAVRLRGEEQVDVLVTQGRVAVHERDAPPADRAMQAHTPRSSSRSVLEAGDMAQAAPAGIRVEKIEQEELTRRLAWQSGVLHFKDEPLATVIAEFNRYNRRRLQIVDPQLAELEVGGSFKANDLESFVAALRGVRGIYIEEGDDRVLLSVPAP